MKREMFFVLCIMFFLSFVSAGLYYEVGLDFKGDEVRVSSVDVVYSRFGYINPSDENYRTFRFDLVSSDGYVVYSEDVGIMDFDFYENLTFDNDSNSEVVRLENFSRTVYLPYDKNVSDVLVYDDEGNLIGENLSDVFNEDVVDSSVVSSEDVSQAGFGLINYLIWIVLVLVAISVVVYFYLIRKDGKKK